MPFTLLSHQAPVLPLKLARPAWFSGTALVLGSMAPDLEYFFRDGPWPLVGHRAVGQLTFCLPLTLLLVALVRGVVAEPLALHLPDAGAFHLRDYALLARARPWTAGELLRLVTSSLVGSFSHLLLDGVSHRNGWAVVRVAWLRAPLWHHVPRFRAFQYGGTILGALVSVALLHHIGRERLLRRWAGTGPRTLGAPSPASHWRLWGAAALFAVGGTTYRVVSGWGERDFRELWYWGHLSLQAASFTFIGLCIGGALATRALTPPPASPPPPTENDYALSRPSARFSNRV